MKLSKIRLPKLWGKRKDTPAPEPSPEELIEIEKNKRAVAWAEERDLGALVTLLTGNGKDIEMRNRAALAFAATRNLPELAEILKVENPPSSPAQQRVSPNPPKKD